MIIRTKSASDFVLRKSSYIECNYKELSNSYKNIKYPSPMDCMAKDMLNLNWDLNEANKEITKLKNKIKLINNILKYILISIIIIIVIYIIFIYNI